MLDFGFTAPALDIAAMKRFLVSVLFAALCTPARADPPPPPVIIDTSVDTRSFLAQMRAAGVRVVGRYLARCPQPEFPGLEGKRLIDQGLPNDPRSEVAQLLANGFAILSIYQYYNGSAEKLSGQWRGNSLPGADCRPAPPGGRSARDEARMDAEAAIRQARDLRQPQGSAIYFGMDFDYLPAADGGAMDARVIDYFTELNRHLPQAGYRIGVYGNGHVIGMLRDRGLADFGWISASAAFTGTSAYHNSGRWHLFQHEVDTEWFGHPSGAGCTKGMILDANLQNPATGAQIGFWTASGPFAIPERDTKAIFDTRRLVCNGEAVVRRTEASDFRDVTQAQFCRGGRLETLPPVARYATSVAIGRRSGNLVEVDVDDDGRMDGWTRADNLTTSFATKPAWIGGTAARVAAKCN